MGIAESDVLETLSGVNSAILTYGSLDLATVSLRPRILSTTPRSGSSTISLRLILPRHSPVSVLAMGGTILSQDSGPDPLPTPCQGRIANTKIRISRTPMAAAAMNRSRLEEDRNDGFTDAFRGSEAA